MAGLSENGKIECDCCGAKLNVTPDTDGRGRAFYRVAVSGLQGLGNILIQNAIQHTWSASSLPRSCRGCSSGCVSLPLIRGQLALNGQV